MILWLALVLMIGAAGLLLFGTPGTTLAGIDATLLAMGISSVVLGGWMISAVASGRQRPALSARAFAIGAGAAALVASGAAGWVLIRPSGSVDPALRTPSASPGAAPETPSEALKAVHVRRQDDGRTLVSAEVNRASVRMLVDTGASTVVLNAADARSAGLDIDQLDYAVPVQTAGGTAYFARVTLRRLSVGGIAVDSVEALVARPGAVERSLLGMTFLSRLRSYGFSGDFLTLRG
jgi:aspartyl protease family protein